MYPRLRIVLVLTREVMLLVVKVTLIYWPREDIKCVLPDDRPRDEGEGSPFICVRGSQGCEDAVRFAKPI